MKFPYGTRGFSTPDSGLLFQAHRLQGFRFSQQLQNHDGDCRPDERADHKWNNIRKNRRFCRHQVCRDRIGRNRAEQTGPQKLADIGAPESAKMPVQQPAAKGADHAAGEREEAPRAEHDPDKRGDERHSDGICGAEKDGGKHIQHGLNRKALCQTGRNGKWRKNDAERRKQRCKDQFFQVFHQICPFHKKIKAEYA